MRHLAPDLSSAVKFYILSVVLRHSPVLRRQHSIFAAVLSMGILVYALVYQYIIPKIEIGLSQVLTGLHELVDIFQIILIDAKGGVS